VTKKFDSGRYHIVTTSIDIHFGTADLICDKTSRTIIMSIQQVILAYPAKGFQVCYILGDVRFEVITNLLSEMGIILNVASRNNHVLEIHTHHHANTNNFTCAQGRWN